MSDGSSGIGNGPFDSGLVWDLVRPILREALIENSAGGLVRRQVCLDKNCIVVRGERIPLPPDHGKIHVLGAGKAVLPMCHGLYEVLGERISGGIVVSLPELADQQEFDEIEILGGSHPVPDDSSVVAGKKMTEYIEEEIRNDDLVFFLVTGGASALLELPLPHYSLSDITVQTKDLLTSGKNIREINQERRKMSAVKGGKLAEMIHPARIVTLAISDIPESIVGSDSDLEMLSLIGSGPTILGSGMEEVEWENDRVFILARNSDLVKSFQNYLQREGMENRIVISDDSGDVCDVAKWYADLIREQAGGGGDQTSVEGGGGHVRRAFLSGGELTVQVTGDGKGGRNQEFVLAVVNELRNFSGPFFVASIGSDGVDGPTDAAGAWADQETYSVAVANGLDPPVFLERNDSYNFFRRLGQLIMTGPTETNVMDIRIIIV